MNTAEKELEIELHGAHGRGQFDRLARFAHWCASQVATKSMAAPLHTALDLARDRMTLPPAVFESRGGYARGQLPMGASLIGLRHGDPRASQMATIVAALDSRLLDAAVQTARNQRMHARFVAEREAGATPIDSLPPSTRPHAVGVATGQVLSARGDPPTRSAAQCATLQLAVWRDLVD